MSPGGPPAGPSLRAKALGWLALREHATEELRTKLKRWAQARGRDAGAEGLEALLQALQAAGHLSDSRFVESRVNVRAPKLGNLRIEHELRRSGAQPDDAVRAALRASEPERARAVWAKRFGRPATDRAERARQARFLAGRGFSVDVIRRVIGDDDAAS
ncbi:MAG: recombination regulator RecX [Rubrivivax sp.]